MEREIIQAFKKGDENALEIIMDNYSKPLLRYSLSIVCDAEEAKDVLQETFIKAYKKRKQFRLDTSFNAWLYRIAYTTAIDAIRSRKRRLTLVKRQSEHLQIKPQNNIQEPLYSILLSLSVADRALLYGKVLDQMSYRELSQVLNASESTLRKRFERLRKQLAKDMETQQINNLI